MLIRVYNNSKQIFEGNSKQFIEYNQYDEFVMDIIKLLYNSSRVEFNDYSGNWIIEKIIYN